MLEYHQSPGMDSCVFSTLLLTSLAMLAFAANSVLCRMALGNSVIDAASFTAIRLLSGAIVLSLILLYQNHDLKRPQFNIVSSLMLFTYAICFSFSYVGLATGTGALILFGAVQLTMISYGVIRGERPRIIAWAGILAAFGGLVYLMLPTVSAPPLDSAGLMVVAGFAWGVYSLRGKTATKAIVATAWNFIGTLPLILITVLIFHSQSNFTLQGITLAILSGALASGIGYFIWYSALPHLKPSSAASVQLSVPVIAAIAGVIFMAEPVSFRLALSSLIILGGIYLTIKPASR